MVHEAGEGGLDALQTLMAGGGLEVLVQPTHLDGDVAVEREVGRDIAVRLIPHRSEVEAF
jgi:hypothetical protein